MKIYPITLEILSPVHIGTGTEYSPLEYLIKDRIFYQFSPEEIYPNWSAQLQRQFSDLVENENPVALRRFFTEHLQPEQSNYGMAVTGGVAKIYRDRFDEVENQLLISPFIRTSSRYTPYLPGSSVKGALRTGVINGLAQQQHPPKSLAKNRNFEFILLKAQERRRDGRWRDKMDKDPFRAIKFSDIYFNNDEMSVGEVKNCAKSRRTGRVEFISIQMFKEALGGKISGNRVQLHGELRWDEQLFRRHAFEQKLDVDMVLKMCRSFYGNELQRELTFYEDAADIYKLLHPLSEEKLAANQTLLRLGRFSGVYAVTIDEYRDPRPPKGKSWGKTRNLFDSKYPMGWIKLTVHR